MGGQYIRSNYLFMSDSAANNYYLSEYYQSLTGFTPIQQAIVTSSMLRSANVDTVAIFKVPVDSPFLGRYNHAKDFVLHKADIANGHLVFVAKNKQNPDQALNTWGTIRFKPDSAFQPTFLKQRLVGKFRHRRPNLNTKDSHLHFIGYFKVFLFLRFQ